MLGQVPLARVKRIMKQDSCDPRPRQVSADTVPFIAYAAKLFIALMTKLAWQLSTQRGRRNTLQVKDIRAAVYASSHFDFLVDVVDLFDEQQQQRQD